MAGDSLRRGVSAKRGLPMGGAVAVLTAAAIASSFATTALAAADATAAANASADPPAQTASAAPTLGPISQRFAAAASPVAAGPVAETPDFQRHVLPLLGRLGCNGRACHGSFQGQGGFRLSLFGYDFDADLKSLSDKANYNSGASPRVSVKDPKASPILRKPTLADDHDGGRRMEIDSWQYRVLLKWVEGGAKGIADRNVRLSRLEVTPREIVFAKAGQTVQLRAVVHWSDGASEEVTPLCRYRTNDEAIATVNDDGLILSKGRGSSHVVAFYDNGVAPVQVMLPVSDRVGADYPSVPTPTKVDELVVAKLRKLGIVPSGLSEDAEFLRRVSLDMTGTLPAPQEVRAFLEDKSADKRAKKIDELLTRPTYAAWWTTKLCDWTGNSDRVAGEQQLGREQARQWYDWIFRRVRDNMPYDKLVEGIVMATGRKSGQSFADYCQEMSSYHRQSNPADFSQRETMPYFWTRRTVRPPKEKALSFSYAFLGVRLQCAECHKHPFDQWTKSDFDQFTAFFAPIDYGTPADTRAEFNKMMQDVVGNEKGNMAQRKLADMVKDGKPIPWRELFVQVNRAGQPVTAPPGAKKNAVRARPGAAGRVVTPKILGGDRVALARFDDPRAALMAWMRDKNNPYFARAIVNRVWASYFNVGIVEPADDLNLANPPSNPELLDYLTAGFVEHGFDMKWLHREIANSRTYQLSWRVNDTNKLDTRHFSHAAPRRLPAEVAYDAIAQATASDARIAAMQQDLSQRSIGPESGTTRNQRGRFALTVFGKPERATNCDCERSTEPSLLQTLFLRNDQDVLAMIDGKDGWLAQAAGQMGQSFNSVPPPADQQQGKKKGPGPVGMPTVAQLEARIAALKAAGNNEQAARVARRLANMKDAQKRENAANKESAKAGGGVATNKPKTAAPAKVTPAKVTSASSRGGGTTADKSQQRPGENAVRDAIDAVYLRTLSRFPTSDERQRVQKHLAAARSKTEGFRDVLWALLNSKEFIVNH